MGAIAAAAPITRRPIGRYAGRKLLVAVAVVGGGIATVAIAAARIWLFPSVASTGWSVSGRRLGPRGPCEPFRR